MSKWKILTYNTQQNLYCSLQLMGIETPEEYSGSGCGFLTMMLVVEELSRVDPAVAAYVDIHNTLVNSLFMKLGTHEQKQKYLTKLCTEYVSRN